MDSIINYISNLYLYYLSIINITSSNYNQNMKKCTLIFYLGMLMLIQTAISTDLFAWVADQTFTVGLTPGIIVPATSCGGPSNVYSDLSPLSQYKGMNGNKFIDYSSVYSGSSSYQLTFETPNFAVPAGAYTLYLKFGKYNSAKVYYEEYEDFLVTIINQRPTLSAPSVATITVYDDLVYWVNFTISDPENSPLLKLRFTNNPNPTWVTIDPSKDYSSILIQPVQLKRSETFTVTVECWDGVMLATNTETVTIILKYDPPKLSGPLEPRTVTVGQFDPYYLPKSVNGRNTAAGVFEGTLFPTYSSIITTTTSVMVKSAPDFTVPAQVKTISLQFVADSNLVEDSYALTIINQVPYFINTSTSVTIYDGLTDRIECLDAESSNLLSIKNKFPLTNPYPVWLTQATNVLSLAPNQKQNETYIIKISAFDGAMESAMMAVTLNLIYDPPYFVPKLQNQTAYVGHWQQYVLPLAQNNRRNFTLVRYTGNVPQISVSSNKSALFNFTYSFGPGLYQIFLKLSAENNEVTNHFNLTLINEPPYLVSNLTNQSFFDCSFLSYTLPNRIDPEGNQVPLMFTYNISSYLSYNDQRSIVYFIPPCNLTKPYYENVTLNITDGFHNVSYAFQIMVDVISPGKKATGVQMLENKLMADSFTASIPPGNINMVPPGKKIPQIDPAKISSPQFLTIPRPKMTFCGQELTYLPDQRIKVGEEITGRKPSFEPPIKGMSMDISCDPKTAKRFTSFEESGQRWYFRPKEGDEGTYNLTLVVTLNMVGHAPQKDKIDFKVYVWNDIPLPSQATNSTQDELVLYTIAQKVNPQIFKVTRKSEITVNFKPKVKLLTIPQTLTNQTLGFYIEPYNQDSFKTWTTSQRQGKFLNTIFSRPSAYLYIPYTIKSFDRQLMNVILNFSSIDEKTLKRYLNERGEGIVNMLINQTIADQEFQDGALLRNPSQAGGAQYVKKMSYSFAYLPPPVDLKYWGKLSKITDALTFAVLPNNVVLRGLTSVSMNFLWGSMNDMSFLTILSLISISVPGTAQIFQSVILKFLYLDVMMTDDWLLPWLTQELDSLAIDLDEEDDSDHRILNEEPDEPVLQPYRDHGINQFFDSSGINSMILLVNLGSTLMYLFFLANFYLLYSILSLLANFIPKMDKLVLVLRPKIFWSWPLTFLLQQFQPLVMLSIINIYDMQTITVLHTASAIMSITLIALTQVSTLGVWYGLNQAKAADKIESETFKKRMGVAFRDLRISSGLYWNVQQMIRWSLVSVILVVLRDQYAFQIILNLVFSVLFQALILRQKPYEQTIENVFLMFNEITVSMYLYFLISLSDFNEHTEQFNFLGMCLLSVVILALGVNFMKFFVIFLISLLRFLKRYIFNDKWCVNYEKKQDQTVVAISPSTPQQSMTTDVTMVDVTNQSLDNTVPWVHNAKRVRFTPQKDGTFSQNTSKPNSRESLMLAQQQFPLRPAEHHFGTFKHGLQTEFFVEFPDKDIIEQEYDDEVSEEEEKDEVSLEDYENIEFEDQIKDVEELVEEVWGKNNQDINF